MGKIFLIKYDEDGAWEYRYELSNFKSITYDLNTPVSPMPLPEENAQENVLIKIEGNSGSINLRWKLIDNNGVNLVTVPSGATAVSSSTIREQLNFFKDFFAPESIEDSYKFVMRLSDSTDFWHYQDIEFKGTFSQFSFTMSDPELLTFNVTAKFLQGRIEPLFATDTPSAPPNVDATSPSAGQIDVTWDTPLDAGSNSITSYRIYWRLFNQGNEWEHIDTGNTSTSKTDISGSTNLAEGVWEVAIKAKTAAGFGDTSDIDLIGVIGV
tara:strand:- start:455 stop:1258 length:804 start_codon:yes stop_codon:yes gene_type:complete